MEPASAGEGMCVVALNSFYYWVWYELSYKNKAPKGRDLHSLTSEKVAWKEERIRQPSSVLPRSYCEPVYIWQYERCAHKSYCVEFHPKQTHSLFKSACSLVFHEGGADAHIWTCWGDRVGGCVRGKTSIFITKAGTDEGTGLQAISLLDITSRLYNNSRVHLIQ
jgi:hypothetical protein